MSAARLDMLLQYYREDPSDPFNGYALAMEYMNSDVEEARRYFEILLNSHPTYLPTYYHAAKLYQETGDREKATEVFEQGIALARQQSNTKALRELQSAYNEFTFE
jgi:tetratricopeptide (TPR) repeat protein